jgi:hypothetical protein
VDSDNTSNQHKDFSAVIIKKKILRITAHNPQVIDEGLVRALHRRKRDVETTIASDDTLLKTCRCGNV